MRANQTLRYYSARVTGSSQLTSREKDILLKRMESMTLEQIGDKYELSAERIRQIEMQALEKVKSSTIQLAMFEDLV